MLRLLLVVCFLHVHIVVDFRDFLHIQEGAVQQIDEIAARHHGCARTHLLLTKERREVVVNGGVRYQLAD